MKLFLGTRTQRTAAAHILYASLLASPLVPAASYAATGRTPPEPVRADSVRVADTEVANLVDRVSPFIVSVDVVVREPSGTTPQVGFAHASSSGVLVSSEGAILTSDRVIEHALAIHVRLPDGRIVAAQVAGRDPMTDLALLRVDVTGLAHVTFADSDALRVGERVVAIGVTQGLEHTATSGIVSARGRSGLGAGTPEDDVQMDATVVSGNAGGPVVTLDGRIVGIAIASKAKGNGLGSAVPSNIARGVSAELLAKGRVDRAWLGVSAQDVMPEVARELHATAGTGALVNAVYPDSPGARGNLKAGDVVLSVDGHAVRGAHDLMREVLGQQVGRVVALEVVRSAKRYATSITLASRGEPAPRAVPAQAASWSGPSLGLSLRDVSAQSAAALGLPPVAFSQVSAVAAGSPAERAGLAQGDAIIEADGQLDPSAAVVNQAMSDGHVLLRVRRGNAFLYVALHHLRRDRTSNGMSPAALHPHDCRHCR